MAIFYKHTFETLDLGVAAYLVAAEKLPLLDTIPQPNGKGFIRLQGR